MDTMTVASPMETGKKQKQLFGEGYIVASRHALCFGFLFVSEGDGCMGLLDLHREFISVVLVAKLVLDNTPPVVVYSRLCLFRAARVESASWWVVTLRTVKVVLCYVVDGRRLTFNIARCFIQRVSDWQRVAANRLSCRPWLFGTHCTTKEESA
jgi:hypothetical protein